MTKFLVLLSLVVITSIVVFGEILPSRNIIHAQKSATSSAITKNQGISVIPSLLKIDLNQDKPEALLYYLNDTKDTVELSLKAQDFNEYEDNGKINLLDEKDAQNYKYSLSSWINFETDHLILNPHEQKAVKIFINQNKLTVGGHYASILAEVSSRDIQNQQVRIRAILSSLVFVRTATGIELEEGNVIEFKAIRQYFDQPDKFLFRFKNSGNVDVVPYGLIEVFDPLQRLVAKGIVNEGSLTVLPESVRRYDVPTKTITSLSPPGFYHAKLTLHFGKSNKAVISQTSFFSQGSFDLTRIGLGLIVCVLGWLVYKWIRRTYVE